MGVATQADAEAIATLRNAAADDLTRRFGKGHWSGQCSERGVLLGLRTSRVLVARSGREIVGTLRLATKKPWAIDVSYFTAVPRAIYLLDMTVLPARQGEGIGRRLLDAADTEVRAWPAQSIRLDAYDAEAGAGSFYAKAGYREVGRVVYRGNPLVYFERML